MWSRRGLGLGCKGSLPARALHAGVRGNKGAFTTTHPGPVLSPQVMLFMKGSPDAPRCGFSRKVVDALRAQAIPFGSFDILQVRWWGGGVGGAGKASHCGVSGLSMG